MSAAQDVQGTTQGTVQSTVQNVPWYVKKDWCARARMLKNALKDSPFYFFRPLGAGLFYYFSGNDAPGGGDHVLIGEFVEPSLTVRLRFAHDVENGRDVRYFITDPSRVFEETEENSPLDHAPDYLAFGVPPKSAGKV